MADPIDSGVQQSPAHRERITYVIKHHSSWRQRSSCDLNGVLTLRGFERSGYERSTIERSNDSHKV